MMILVVVVLSLTAGKQLPLIHTGIWPQTLYLCQSWFNLLLVIFDSLMVEYSVLMHSKRYTSAHSSCLTTERGQLHYLLLKLDSVITWCVPLSYWIDYIDLLTYWPIDSNSLLFRLHEMLLAAKPKDNLRRILNPKLRKFFWVFLIYCS